MEEYKYNGIELTPQVFSELMVALLDGKQFERSTAIKTVTEYHEKNGGLVKKHEYIGVFKRACSILKDNGLVNAAYGTWRLNYKVKDIQIAPKENPNTVSYKADKVIGKGDNIVYVYYYDVYKRLSALDGKDVFECKIGRSDGDAFQRILSQTGTCYPELPHVALIILCDNSRLLEATIHNILKLKNKHIASAPGTEWFMTSPEEVEQIYKCIV